MLALFVVPNIFGVKVFTVASGSMIPRYDIGSLIYVKKVEPNDIAIGDSITFHMQDTDTIATHEVYEISEGNTLFKTQGINNKNGEGEVIHDLIPTPYDKIIGKVIFSIPGFGYLYNFLSNSVILCILITITVLMIIVPYFLRKRKE